jgi:integrase
MKPQPKIRLLYRVRQAVRLKNYSYSTEKSYVYWSKRYILFHDKRHPETMGGPEIEKFLSYLAVERNLSASTQNQALCALLFLYQGVLQVELDSPINSIRAKRPKRLPFVITKTEVQSRLDAMSGKHKLMARLLNGQCRSRSRHTTTRLIIWYGVSAGRGQSVCFTIKSL